MVSVGLPSVALWQGMQGRANALPLFMLEALQDTSGLPMQRVRAALRDLAAAAHFVQATRLALYCRECDKLLELYAQQDGVRATIAPVLLRAALRAAASLSSPMRCLIDSANLDELRHARGADAVARTATVHSALWTTPRLKTLLRRRLLHAHYSLGDASKNGRACTQAAQPNSFPSLIRVAALWTGEALLEGVDHAANFQQTCMQILRLELCCQEQSEGSVPRTLCAMRRLYLEASTQRFLRGLRKELRVLIQKAEQPHGVSIERSLWAFHRVNAGCALLRTSQVQAIAKISVSGQQLALHLRCWAQRECEASSLLCLCILALERHLDIAIAVLRQRRPRERADMRLQRRVQFFIRTHRRRLRAAYAVPVKSVSGLAQEELRDIHRGFRRSLRLCTQAPVEDEFFHALIRFKSISLYMGELALYELLWNLRELVVLAIESKVLLTKTVLGLLPRLTAYCLRSFIRGRVELGYDTRLINSLSEALRAQRQVMLLKSVRRENKISLPARQRHGKKKGQHSIGTTALPSYLARNIRSLIADPVAIYHCRCAQQFTGISRELVLELTLVARGARALQVERVAALSEVLLEIYRALNALTALPEQGLLKRNLQGAHRCLRLALNRAAARQQVCDVRPTIAELYHFLECLHQAPAHSPDSLQATLSAVNVLAADMRGFADVFASVSSHGRGGRYHLAGEQLQGLLAATRRLQEDLSENTMINIARWRQPLTIAVGRCSNEWGKHARLELFLDEIEAARALVQQSQAPLERVLCLMIEHSIEGLAQRRGAGKPDSACLRVRAAHAGDALRVTLEDDGKGLSASQLAGVTEQVGALGGSLSLENAAVSGSLVSVIIPCASVRWDIASKSL